MWMDAAGCGRGRSGSVHDEPVHAAGMDVGRAAGLVTTRRGQQEQRAQTKTWRERELETDKHRERARSYWDWNGLGTTANCLTDCLLTATETEARWQQLMVL
jgi:hypothetical protein